ncbi:hypothetical protein [Burkholderia stabilis]
MKPRLTDLLKVVKPERALFTTFTLSLSWFESFCLPILRAEGCEQVDLLVDSKEACKAGAESASAYAGNAFWVTPVAMQKNGIFHAKIAYLQGSTDDTLVIGSGNLTQPGQGGNLEVIDAVSTNQHPQVFEEFADFVDRFLTRPGLSTHVIATLKSYAARAREVAELAPASVRSAPRTAWLIHTLDIPAYEQLGLLAESELDNPVELTVFSPFHSRSAAAVGHIAERCNVLRTRIALLPKWSKSDGDYIYVAPFEKNAAHLPKKHSFVKAVTGMTPRTVHAKCIEIRSTEACLVLTGSINATRQSLCETRNVEVGLVRKTDVSPFKWEAVAKPDVYERCEYGAEEEESGSRVCVEATMTEKGLSGTLAPNTTEQVVRLEIWSRNRCELVIPEVSVGKSGAFSVDIATETLNTEFALRLKVLGNDENEDDPVVAVGWLNVETVLAFPPIDRNLAQAATNIASGKPSERDLHAILEHFRRVLKRELRIANAPAQTASRTTVEVPQPPPRKTGFDQWSTDEQKALGVSPKTARQILAAAFASLRTADVVRSRPEKPENPEAGNDKEKAEDTPAKAAPVRRSPPRKRPRRKLPDNPFAEMLKTLPLVLRVNATGIWIPSLVAVSFAEHLSRNLKVLREIAGDNAVEYTALGQPLKQWFSDYAKFDYGEANRMRLLELFCGVAACTVFFGGEAVNPPKIKQNLEVLMQRTLTADEWLEYADVALGTQPFEALGETLRAHVLEGALTLAESLATRQELEAVVISVFNDGKGEASQLSRYRPIFDMMSRARQHRRQYNKKDTVFGIISADVHPIELDTRCPACNHVLNDRDVVNDLTRDGVAVHTTRCKKPIFIGLSMERLAAGNVPRWAIGYTDV